jgi:hypothetical protein
MTIKCQFCKGKYDVLSSQHLATHGLTRDAYKAKYPKAPLVSKHYRKATSDRSKKAIENLPPERRKRIIDQGIANLEEPTPGDTIVIPETVSPDPWPAIYPTIADAPYPSPPCVCAVCGLSFDHDPVEHFAGHGMLITDYLDRYPRAKLWDGPFPPTHEEVRDSFADMRKLAIREEHERLCEIKDAAYRAHLQAESALREFYHQQRSRCAIRALRRLGGTATVLKLIDEMLKEQLPIDLCIREKLESTMHRLLGMTPPRVRCIPSGHWLEHVIKLIDIPPPLPLGPDQRGLDGGWFLLAKGVTGKTSGRA